MGRKDARKIVPGELVLDQIPLQVQLLEEKSGKEELTWRGRTPPRRASRPGRCPPTTKPCFAEMGNLHVSDFSSNLMAELTFDRTELGRRESRRSWRAWMI